MNLIRKMKINIIASLVLLGLAAVSCADNPTKSESRTDGPNFLFIITDDQRWDALAYAGNEIIQTPNMDQLAAEGTYFSNAFVTTPICAASRASILTGMYERSHGYTFGTDPLRKELIGISYPALLRAEGYHTGYIGKLGVNYEEKQDTTSFDYYKPQDWGNYYYKLVDNNHKHRHQTNIKGDQAIEYLNTVPDGQNFCLTLSFNAPHAEDQALRQFIWPAELDSLYEDVTIPPPMMGDPEWFEAQPDFIQKGLNRIRWNWRFNTEEKYQHMVKGHYRMITGIDNVIARLRAELEEKGLAENTIIVFIGDNGFFLGERGFAGKWLMYEHSLRVPMIIYNPQDKKSLDLEIDELVLNIDLAPTILELAGLEIPGEIQGKSLLPLIEGTAGDWREDFLCEHLFDHEDIPQSEGVRSEMWKYFRYREHPEHEELYNLQDDPFEMVNLAGRSEYKNQLEQLRMRCNEYISALTTH